MNQVHDIEPVRMTAIRKRAAVLKRYCAIENPSDKQTAAHAAQIGVGINRFLTLVKAWRARPAIECIEGATVRADRVPKLVEGAMSVLREVMQELGPLAPVTTVHSLVHERCVTRAIEAPSMAAVHYRVMKERAHRKDAPDEAGYVVFQCRAQIPVTKEGTIHSPWLTGAIELPSLRIVHPTMTIGEPEDPSAILEKLLPEIEDRDIASTIYVPTSAFRAPPADIKKTVRPAGKKLRGSMLLGGRLSNLTIFHRAYPGMDAKLARRLDGQLNNALSPAEVRAVILKAVASHNQNRT